jgi:protein TonB
MYAYAMLPLASARSRRDALILATILAGHVALFIVLNSGLRLPELFPPVTLTPIKVIEERSVPLPEEMVQPPGPLESVPEPEPPPVRIEVDAGRTVTRDVVAWDIAPVPGQGGAAGSGEPIPHVYSAPQPDPRLLAAGRWSPEMPASVQRLARTAGDLGTTVLRCVVGLSGRCERVQVVASSGNERLDAAARRHAERTWRFSPATRGDEPVVADYELKITWRVVD